MNTQTHAALSIFGQLQVKACRARSAPAQDVGQALNGVAPLQCCQVSATASTSGRSGEPSVWAAIINFERLGKADAAGDAEPNQAANGKRAAQYIVDVLANCAADTVPGHGPKR